MSPLTIPEYREQPELAIVALFYLLSRFPYVGCAAMAASIQRHFDWLSQEPRLPPAVQRAALDLASQWSDLLAAGPHPEDVVDADADADGSCRSVLSKGI
jgi:hypothetical protein